MRIQHNIMAMNAYRNYTGNTSALSKNLEKLSSGYKINRAGDDAAGLAISEKMRAQITGLNKAQDNAKDGISLVQTAEGALTEVHDMLNRMYEIAEQSANGTYENETDRKQLQKEVSQLKSEIDRIADSSNFNGIKLLDGSMSDVSTHVLKADADSGANKGAVDLKVELGKWTKDDGTRADVTVAFAAGDTTGVAIDDNGKVTVTLKKTEEATAEQIRTAIANLTVTSANLSDTEKASLSEVLKNVEVSGTGYKGTAKTTAGFNGTLATTAAKGDNLTLQIGDTSETFNQLKVGIKDCHVDALGIKDLDIGNQEGAADALDTIKSAINYVSDVRGTLGATQNRLDHTINNLSVMEENIQDAESTIRDTDVADEMMAYTKNNILIQSAQAMLAQANQVPQGVLQLLQ